MATQPNAPTDMTFDSTPVQQDTPVQGQTPQTQDSGMTFDSAPVQQSTPVDQLADSRTPEEQAFLSKNPDYAYVPRDPKFPNRQEGIYHKQEAGLNDPEMEHHPVDPELLKHSVQYGVGSAAAVGGTTAGSMALPAMTDAAVALSAKLPQAVEYMSHLDNIMKVAKTLGWAGFGLKEAADVYKTIKSIGEPTKKPN